MSAKDLTKTVTVIGAAIFLLECQTAAIVAALYYTLAGKVVPQNVGTFIGIGLAYSAGVLGISIYKKNGNGNGNGNGGNGNA